MGTSKSSNGEVPAKPIVPSWVEGNNIQEETGETETSETSVEVNLVREDSQHRVEGDPNRLKSSKSQFTKFVRSDGINKSHMKKAVSNYIRDGVKGYSNLSKRMGAEKAAALKLANILWVAQREGIKDALQNPYGIDLSRLGSKDLYKILIEEIARPGGNVDDSLVRESYVETLQELGDLLDEELESPSLEFSLIFLEMFIVNTIFNRIVRSVCAGIVKLASSPDKTSQIEKEIKDLISGKTSDAFEKYKNSLTAAKMQKTIEAIYIETLKSLEAMEDN